MWRPSSRNLLAAAYGVIGWLWLLSVWFRIRNSEEELTFETFSRESKALAFSGVGLSLFAAINAITLWRLLSPRGRSLSLGEKMGEVGVILAMIWAFAYMYFFMR